MNIRRVLWLAAVSYLVLLSSVRAADPPRVRVLTYNIHHGEGTDGKLDLPRIANVIKQVAPDVVALQEVDKSTRRSQGVDQAAELGKLTGMHHAFGQAMDYAGGEYGEALLSKYPLSDVQVHELPFTPDCEPRSAIAARIRLGETGPEFIFVGTHLEHAKATLRLCQSNKLNPILVAKNALPTILAGDLNDVPESPTIRVLKSRWKDASEERPAPTWPSDRPTKKIDYVLFRPEDVLRVVEQRVVAEPTASDHRPLLVVLEWSEAKNSSRQ